MEIGAKLCARIKVWKLKNKKPRFASCLAPELLTFSSISAYQKMKIKQYPIEYRLDNSLPFVVDNNTENISWEIWSSKHIRFHIALCSSPGIRYLTKGIPMISNNNNNNTTFLAWKSIKSSHKQQSKKVFGKILDIANKNSWWSDSLIEILREKLIQQQ